MVNDRRSFLAGAAGLALTGTLRAEEEKTLTVLFFGGALPQVQKEMEKLYRMKALKGG